MVFMVSDGIAKGILASDGSATFADVSVKGTITYTVT
jgi:hypothetical protein